jgi:hypothetical protein
MCCLFPLIDIALKLGRTFLQAGHAGLSEDYCCSAKTPQSQTQPYFNLKIRKIATDITWVCHKYLQNNELWV